MIDGEWESEQSVLLACYDDNFERSLLVFKCHFLIIQILRENYGILIRILCSFLDWSLLKQELIRFIRHLLWVYIYIYIYLDGNYTRMLWAILNKSWRQHPTKQQLYGHLPPITKTIKVRWTRHAEHCWRSRDELISDVLLWTPSHGRAKAGRPAQTYIQQLSEDMGCSPEDLPEAMNDREEWRERVRDIHAGGTTRWWYIF